MGKPLASNTMLNKAGRAKLAKATINRTIPRLRSSDAQARRGVQPSELITHPAVLPQGSELKPPIIPILHTDTLTAVASLQGTTDASTSSSRNIGQKTAILNIASAHRSGGGVLNGASSQEEFPCLRTTLYPSLHENYNRLPKLGVIYKPDSLVFRAASCIDLSK